VRKMRKQTVSETDPENRDSAYFAASPLMIFPNTLGKFKVFIKQAGKYVLYAGENEQFTERHRRRLHDHGVKEVYIKAGQRLDFDRYIENNLPQILADDDISLEERAGVFYEASISVVKDVFESRLPAGLTKRQFTRIASFVEKSAAFLCEEASLKQLASLASHDYTVYAHSVHVFVYSSAILQSLRMDEHAIVQSGIGAMLHDLGKAAIDRDILNKPGPLTQDERATINTHPVKGVALCMDMPLTHAASSCILLHHERMDGSGYPGGVGERHIPLHVRAVSVADVYDALTTTRPYAEAISPFEALKIMRDDMAGAFDLDIYKRLVMILSGADIL
jgi:HD-GYP domain-containing protein (c-di-GMP phosphodiesterase class II)